MQRFRRPKTRSSKLSERGIRIACARREAVPKGAWRCRLQGCVKPGLGRNICLFWDPPVRAGSTGDRSRRRQAHRASRRVGPTPGNAGKPGGAARRRLGRPARPRNQYGPGPVLLGGAVRSLLSASYSLPGSRFFCAARNARAGFNVTADQRGCIQVRSGSMFRFNVYDSRPKSRTMISSHKAAFATSVCYVASS